MYDDRTRTKVQRLKTTALSLGDAGRHSEAVAALDEALGLLAPANVANDPEVKALAADLLSDKATWLVGADDEAALHALEQAAGHLTDLARSDPDGVVQQLTTARYFQVRLLSALGRHAEALAVMSSSLADLLPMVETRGHLVTMDAIALVDGYVRLSADLDHAVDEAMVRRYAELAGLT